MWWLVAILGGLVVAAVCVYGLHRMALWAEGRGWILYKEKGRFGAVSNALLELEAIWKPEIHHVIEERAVEADHEVDDESGDDGFDVRFDPAPENPNRS